MIFTIGYSNRTLPEFLHELQRRSITQLADVRSSPWSRNTPFNASQITKWTEPAGIMCRQFGDVLGGRTATSLDASEYIDALGQLIEAARREPLAIMCAEGRPEDCHRTWDIGASLLFRHGIIARSILRDGREEDITATLLRVPRGKLSDIVRNALFDGDRSLI